MDDKTIVHIAACEQRAARARRAQYVWLFIAAVTDWVTQRLVWDHTSWWVILPLTVLTVWSLLMCGGNRQEERGQRRVIRMLRARTLKVDTEMTR